MVLDLVNHLVVFIGLIGTVLILFAIISYLSKGPDDPGRLNAKYGIASNTHFIYGGVSLLLCWAIKFVVVLIDPSHHISWEGAMENFTALIGALATLAWPLLVIVVVGLLLPSIKSILESRRFTLKYGDAELSVQDASDQLRKQIQDLQDEVAAFKVGGAEPNSPTPLEISTAEDTTILWVDDRPSNNAFEVAKLQDDGYSVIQVKSTDEAMPHISDGLVPKAIISDMGRREAGRYISKAGLELIRQVRGSGLEVPIFIYTTKKYAQAHHDESLEAGGNGATASPVALFQMIERGIT